MTFFCKVIKPVLVFVLALLASPAWAQTPAPMAPSSPLTAYALRLKPGDDLRQQLTAFVAAHHLEAGAVLTCVASLTHVSLRLANQEAATHYHGHFEIVSLVGTLSASGGGHLHLAVADSTGRTLGGHLLDGCRIYKPCQPSARPKQLRPLKTPFCPMRRPFSRKARRCAKRGSTLKLPPATSSSRPATRPMPTRSRNWP